MLFLLFYFFAFWCVKNVVLKEKFWVENFILFKLCYFYVIFIKNKLRHLIIIRCHSLLSQKLDSIKPLSHPRCVLISGSNDKEFLCACNDAGDYNDFIYTALPHMFFLPFYVCFCCFVLCS